MTLWPPQGGFSSPHYVIEFQATSFTKATSLKWLLEATSPTEAVVLALKDVLSDFNFVKGVLPTADVRYQVWLATPEDEKGFELTGAVNTRTVDDYLVMHRSVEAAPPRLYTVLLAHTEESKKAVSWMTLQARTPTEALIVCKTSDASYQLRFAGKCFFSIYEGWMKPHAMSEERSLLRMPTAYMHGTVVPKKPKHQKHRSTEMRGICIDWQEYYEDCSPNCDDRYENVMWIYGGQKDVSRDVNFELLRYLLTFDSHLFYSYSRVLSWS